MGELLRRYWMPVGYVEELTDENPTRFVRIMGEDLVLWKDKSGNVGLMQDHCPHRGASMLYGRVEERGIACAYHGWLYDTQGNCLETPAEPADSKFYLTVKATAYPVQKFIGMYWAYLGPLPAPVIPPYDVWVRKDGTRHLYLQPQLDANWLQPMENSMDPAHLQVLHQNTAQRNRIPPNTTRGFTDDVDHFDFYETDWSFMKHRVYRNGREDEHPVLFPNILRQGDATQIRVPIDDEHTKIFFVRFTPTPDGSIVEDEGEPEVTYIRSYKEPADRLHPYTKFDMSTEVQAQDHMAWETQGPITDRSVERLASSDRGIVMFRNALRREYERMVEGLDPKAVLRDPNHPMIDTNLTASLEEMQSQRQRQPAGA
jgi:5,5'-dehydrodivanillate O-demethylase